MTEPRDCNGCAIGDAMERRDFLRSLLAMGAVFVTGVGPRAEKIYPIPVSDGVSIDKDESVIVARWINTARSMDAVIKQVLVGIK